jgi:hypothetical protein
LDRYNTLLAASLSLSKSRRGGTGAAGYEATRAL